MSAVGNRERVDLQLQDWPSGNLALCHRTVFQEEVQMRTRQAFKSQEPWPAVTTLLLGCQVRPRMCAVVVVVGRRVICLCVCACALCVGEEEWRLLTWFLFFATKASDHCVTQYHLDSLKEIISIVGLHSYTVVAQGKKTSIQKDGSLLHCWIILIRFVINSRFVFNLSLFLVKCIKKF